MVPPKLGCTRRHGDCAVWNQGWNYNVKSIYLSSSTPDNGPLRSEFASRSSFNRRCSFFPRRSAQEVKNLGSLEAAFRRRRAHKFINDMESAPRTAQVLMDWSASQCRDD